MSRKFLHEEIYRGAEALAKLAEPQIVVCAPGALGRIWSTTSPRQLSQAASHRSRSGR